MKRQRSVTFSIRDLRDFKQDELREFVDIIFNTHEIEVDCLNNRAWAGNDLGVLKFLIKQHKKKNIVITNNFPDVWCEVEYKKGLKGYLSLDSKTIYVLCDREDVELNDVVVMPPKYAPKEIENYLEKLSLTDIKKWLAVRRLYTKHRTKKTIIAWVMDSLKDDRNFINNIQV